MSNLVPVHIDKDTGKLVAKSNAAVSGALGHEHKQLIPATTWTIEHSGGTTFLIQRIFDINHFEIIPDGFQIVDDDTVKVYFSTPQTGFAHLIFFTQIQ